MKYSPLFALAMIASSLTAGAADIVALCIGNDAHHKPEDVLDTPVADATLMADTLRSLPGVQEGDILLVADADREAMNRALRTFKAKAAGSRLALVFYSGHGMEDTPIGETRPETFLLPVDADITGVDVLPDRAIALHEVLEALKGASGARAVILDCCRTGAPSATKAMERAGKSVSEGLDASVKRALGSAVVPEGTLIAFAAGPGRKAAAFLTEEDAHSPFTLFLTDQMRGVGGDLLSIVNAATRVTKQRTENRQVPHVEVRGDLSLITDFVIGPGRAAPVTPFVPANRRMEGTTAGETRSFGGIEMVWCPPGEFLMGSPESEDVYEYNETQHRVTLTKGFWLAMTECTQRQWESVMGTDVDRLKGTAAEDATFGDVNAVGPAVAMYFTSWNDAQDWLGEMNQTQPLPAGWKWTLPTEAQWEYACRAGTKTETYAGPLVVQGIHNAPTLDSIAWYSGNSSVSYTGEGTETGDWEEKQYPGGTAGVRQVGLKQPNAWGLHDMLGNVWEWCADWRGDYSNTSVADPRGETDGTLRVDRGGGWYGYSWDCRSPARGSMSPETRGDYLGFRPAASFQGFQ